MSQKKKYKLSFIPAFFRILNQGYFSLNFVINYPGSSLYILFSYIFPISPYNSKRAKPFPIIMFISNQSLRWKCSNKGSSVSNIKTIKPLMHFLAYVKYFT